MAFGVNTQSFQLEITPPIWKTWLFYLIIATLIIFVSYYVIRQKIKRLNKEAALRQEKLKAENESQLAQEQLEKEKLEFQLVKNEVDFKKREMVAYSIQLNRKNELLLSMKEELNALKGKVESGSLKGIKKLINENLNFDNDWDSFKIHFNGVHPEFFEKLKSKYPTLSPGELKYCAYFKIQLSNKEIARLLNVTPKAVHIAKYRIKKKLDLTKEDDLMNFLLHFD